MEKYELGNAALEKVTGGDYYTKEYYTSSDAVEFIFNVNDVVQVQNWFLIGTVTCRITAVRTVQCGPNTGVPGQVGARAGGWVDEYYCEKTESCWYFPNGWYTRDALEKRTI